MQLAIYIRTLISYQKCLDKQDIPRKDSPEEAVWSCSTLITFLVSILWIHSDYYHFILKPKEKSVRKFRTFTENTIVRPVFKRPLKIYKTKVLKTNCSLMKVKRIAECSKHYAIVAFESK